MKVLKTKTLTNIVSGFVDLLNNFMYLDRFDSSNNDFIYKYNLNTFVEIDSFGSNGSLPSDFKTVSEIKPYKNKYIFVLNDGSNYLNAFTYKGNYKFSYLLSAGLYTTIEIVDKFDWVYISSTTTITLKNTITFDTIVTKTGFTNVKSVSFNNIDNRVYVLDDNTIKIYDKRLSTLLESRNLLSSDNIVPSAILSSGYFIYVVSQNVSNRFIYVYTKDNMEQVTSLSHNYAITGIFDVNDKYFICFGLNDIHAVSKYNVLNNYDPGTALYQGSDIPAEDAVLLTDDVSLQYSRRSWNDGNNIFHWS